MRGQFCAPPPSVIDARDDVLRRRLVAGDEQRRQRITQIASSALTLGSYGTAQTHAERAAMISACKRMPTRATRADDLRRLAERHLR